jgi:hypothetical protein
MLSSKEMKHKFLKWQGDKTQAQGIAIKQNTSSRNGYVMKHKGVKL